MKSGTRQVGMTLIELMVAMAIGLFLIGGALYVYSQSKSIYRASDSVARLQETARFALDALEPDVRLARYWGLTAEPARVTVPAGVVVRCGATDITAFATDFAAAVESRDDDYDLPCPAFASAARAGSDVLILRHAEPWSGGTEPAADAGRLQVQTTLNRGQVFNDGLSPDLGTASTRHNVVFNAYYVSDESTFESTRPALRRLTLRANGTVGEEEVIPGVENLQVQLGMDTNRDGNVDRYVDGDHPLVTVGAPEFDPDAQLIAVRIWMLVSTPADDPGWEDTQTYPTPDADLGPIEGGSPDYPASARRLQITRTIFLNNQGA